MFQSKSSPSEMLLHEIGNRFCTVGVLCEILLNCQLYDALALLREPERVVITQQPSDDEDTIYIPEGTDLRLECRAFGLPPPKYVWFQGNEELKAQTSSILLIRDFSVQHEGEYYCCVSQDVDGEEVCQVYSHTVNVELLPVPPTIHEHPVPCVVFREGDVITLSCFATGYPEPQYEWFKENFQLPGEETNTLTIGGVGASCEGSYRCYVKNRGGAVWSNHSNLSMIVPNPDDESRTRITATEKVALLIGNDTYTDLSDLNTPRNDVATIASILKDIGFKVIALHNLTLNEMRNAVYEFCQLLPQEGYGFFYFVGHGFEIQDKFMLPVDAPGSNEYRRCNSLCEKEVIRDVMKVKPKLFLILLDMCLKIPSRNENPGIHEELPKAFLYEPKRNLIQQYATTSNLGAYERSTEVNGIYVNHLKKHLEKNITILNILKMVQKEIANESADAADKQMPLTSSNVVDDFCLTDSVTGHPETEIRFQKLMALPAVDTIVFDNIGWKSVVKIQPHRDCFHNSLDIYITNMAQWAVVCCMACEKLKLELHREGDVLVITIHNLQKTKMPIVLSVILKDPESKKEVSSYTFDLEMPLITQAHLWFNCSRPSSP
ncbi:mucosa-associated lymphoid tissue lymphoma translocation protein 1 homolog isoform X2 [Zootermopsis nevadensis]|nr:mucosa-associated lymphoid tissue lymphoma translocation protein 1 homolog isoform X2 [Zootermopsis nevadensis]